jgi:hypothetical protein
MTDRRRVASERRSVRRAPFVASVRQRVGTETQLALAQNLGERGMELRRRPGRAYRPRTPIQLAFELPDGGDLVRVRAIVTFDRFDGCWQATGVRFVAMSDVDWKRIRDYVARTLEVEQPSLRAAGV